MFRSILALLKVYSDIQTAVNQREAFQLHRAFQMDSRQTLNVSVAGVLSENKDPDAPEFKRFNGDLFFHLIGITADLQEDSDRDGRKDVAIREYSIYLQKDNTSTPENDAVWLNIRVELQLLTH